MSLLIKGVTALSELTIDTSKDWAAKKIENLGEPDSADDAERHDHTHDAGDIVSGRFGTDRLEWTINKILQGAGVDTNPTEHDMPAGKPSFTQIYDGEVPSTGYLLPLGILPYGSASTRDFFAVVQGSYIYVGGGVIETDETFFDEFFRLNMDTGEWTRLGNLPAGAKFNCQAAYHNGKIYTVVADSAGNTYNGHLFCYDVSADTWSDHDLSLGTNRHFVLPLVAKLYIVDSPASGNASFYEVDYANLDTKAAKAILNGICGAAAVVSDTVYIFDYTATNADWKLLEYNTVGDSWDDTGFVCAEYPRSAFSFDIEDRDYMWVAVYANSDKKLYRSDCAHNFTEQLNMGTSAFGHIYLQRSGETNMYVTFGGTNEIPNNAYGLIEMAGVWELCSQAFGQGDFLIVDAHGVPVNLSVGGVHKETISQYRAQIIIAAETWNFRLSKDYDYSEVDIWRAYYA